MAQRLASLMAQATLDASKYAQGAQQVDAANTKMRTGQAAVGQTMTQTQVKVSESARAFDKYHQTLDKGYRSQVQFEAGERRINLALEKGNITVAQHTQLMTLLNAKYAQAATAQAGMAASASLSMGAWKSLAGTIGLVTIALGAKEYIQFADTMATVSSRLKLVAGSAAEVAKAQEALFGIAQRTRTEFEANVTLYTRVGRSAAELNLSQEKVLQLTELVQQGLKLSGASAGEAASTVLQLSQALASGRLSGAELNAVLESGGRVAIALADGLNVPIGSLKKLGEQGKLTSDVVIKALLSQKDVLDREFKSLPLTVSDAMIVVRNEMLRFVGEVDKSAHASGKLATSIAELGEVLKDPNTIAAGVAVIEGLVNAFVVLGRVIAGAKMALDDFSKALPKDLTLTNIDRGLGGMATEALRAFGLSNADPAKARGLFATISGGVAADLASPSNAAGAGAFGTTDAADAKRRADRTQRRAEEAKALAERQAAEEKAEKERKARAEREVKDAERRRREMDKYLKSLDDELRLAKLTVDEREQEEAILRAQAISINRVTGEQIALTAAAKDEIRARVKAVQEIEAQAKALEEQKKKTEAWVKEGTDRASDLIASVFERGADGAKAWLAQVKSWFFKLLADMAAQALANPIIVPLVTGALGLAGGASLGGASSGSLGGLLGSIGGGIDSVGRSLGLQAGGATGPYANNTGLFGSNTYLSGAVGAGAAGLGLGATTAALTGGNALGGSIGGALGGVAGQVIGGPLGALIGSALGGFVGSLFGNGPSNNGARADFDAFGGFAIGGSKRNDKTSQAALAAATQISSALAQLQQGGGATLTQALETIRIGERDNSSYTLVGGERVSTGAVGDPNELALAVVNALASSATFKNAYLGQVVKGNEFKTVDELTRAVAFTRDVYTAIADAERPLTQVEQEMKALAEHFDEARKTAAQLGLSLEKFDAGAKKSFDQSIADQIKSITDPVGLALEEFERSAQARLELAKKLGGDLLEVEKLNGLQRAQVLGQIATQSFAGLKSLINDIAFGSLSAAAPDKQYFSALTAYNTAKRSALESSSPTAIADFESASRALLPIARSFLGTSQQYGALESDIVGAARQLGGDYADPAHIGAAIVEATNAGTAAIVDTLEKLLAQNAELLAENKRQAAQLQALLNAA